MLNAELEMAALLLPELFEFFTSSLFKSELSFLNSKSIGAQIINTVVFDSQGRKSQMTTVIVHTRIDQLEVGVAFFDLGLYLFPINLKLFALGDLGSIGDNQRIVEILLYKNDFTILANLVFNYWCWPIIFFLLSFGIALFSHEFWQSFVSSASNLFSFNIHE